MHGPYLLFIVLVVPATLAFIFNDWAVGLGMLAASVIAARVSRRSKPTSRRMTLLALVINQLVIIHSIYHYRPTEISGVDMSLFAVKPESDGPRPFVSVVLFHNPNATTERLSKTLASLEAHTSPVLAKEIVIPDDMPQSDSENVPRSQNIAADTDFIVFVAPGVEVQPDWLNGMVREFIANDTRLVVPLISFGRQGKLAASMVGSTSGGLQGLPVTEQGSKSVPIIPYFTLLGVSRKTLTAIPSIPQLLSDGRVMELSLRAWFCHSGIIFTRFTEVTIEEPYATDWKSLEGLDVDEKITNCPYNIDWFYEEFKAQDPDAPVTKFLIRSGDRCLTASSDFKLKIESACETTNPYHLFESKLNEIKSVGVKDPHCMDAASAMKPGKKPILYHCMHNNSNQVFHFMEDRLMWGSFCLERHDDNSVTLEKCKGFRDSLDPNQRWLRELVDSKSPE
jgi:hypothetical protein